MLEEDNTEVPSGAMDYITDMLGTAFRDKMIDRLGGTSIKPPTHKKWLTDDHVLVVALGMLDAEELVEVVPGEAFYVPCRVPQQTPDRVAALTRAGKLVNEIARELGISERHVRRCRSGQGLSMPELKPRPQEHPAERS